MAENDTLCNNSRGVNLWHRELWVTFRKVDKGSELEDMPGNLKTGT